MFPLVHVIPLPITAIVKNRWVLSEDGISWSIILHIVTPIDIKIVLQQKHHISILGYRRTPNGTVSHSRHSSCYQTSSAIHNREKTQKAR